MSNVTKLAATGLALAMTAVSLSPAAAAPLSGLGSAALKSAGEEVSQVETVGRRGWRHDRRYYGRHRGGDALAAGALGLAAGALIGGSLAQPRYYSPPPPRVYYQPAPVYNYAPPMWSGDWYAYCASRYRSFDPSSGTYLGYDGYRHYCQ